MELSATAKQFILHWGEMGARWGINRTVAQIHALLFLAPKPLAADDIATALSVARSHVSNSLRELQGWGIVRIIHVLGDRRDHYLTLKDVWHLFTAILAERKKRECDPTRVVLERLLQNAKNAGPKEEYTRDRIAEMLDFFETMGVAFDQIQRLPKGALVKLVNAGDKFGKLLGMA